jgi:membrane protease YdiL (CAAX protease family)
MNDIHSHFNFSDKPPVTRLIFSILLVIVFGMSLLTLMFFAGGFIFGLDPSAASEALLPKSEETNIWFLRFFMILQDICLFIIPGIIILHLLKPVNSNGPSIVKIPRINEIILVVLLAFCIFPITSFTGELNARMHFPDWLSEVEKWMEEKEAYAGDMIGLLIASDTFLLMLFNLLMIAVLPAIGEELIFRGVFQKILYGFFRSGQPAVWIIAIIFSTIHFQFFGLIPRFILGLVFGYLYLWSKTLWLPVIAHFVNNAVPVIGGYIKGIEYVTSNQDISLWKQAIGLPVPIFAAGMILWYFRNRSLVNYSDDSDPSGSANV